MKNIKYILAFVMLAFATVSCESYDDFESIAIPTVAIAAKGNPSLPTIRDGEFTTVDVKLFVSVLSTADRTFNLVVDNSVTTMSPDNYAVPATVTMPAGENLIYFPVTFTDVSLTTDRQPVKIDLVSGPDGVIIGSNSVTYLIKTNVNN